MSNWADTHRGQRGPDRNFLALLTAITQLGNQLTDALATAAPSPLVVRNLETAILVNLFDASPQRPGDLAQKLGTSSARISQGLRSLESCGLVERRRGESSDRRLVQVRKTTSADDYLIRAARAFSADPAALDRLNSALRLVAGLHERREPMAPKAPLIDAFHAVVESASTLGNHIDSLTDPEIGRNLPTGLLTQLALSGQSTPGAMAVAHRVPPTKISETLSRLERLGLIHREFNSLSDRRTVTITLSPKGADYLAALQAAFGLDNHACEQISRWITEALPPLDFNQPL